MKKCSTVQFYIIVLLYYKHPPCYNKFICDYFGKEGIVLKKSKVSAFLAVISVICAAVIILTAVPAFASDNDSYSTIEKSYVYTFGIDNEEFSALSDNEKWDMVVNMDAFGCEKTPFYTKISLYITKLCAQAVDSIGISLPIFRNMLVNKVVDTLEKYSAGTPSSTSTSTVYFTSDISPDGLVKIYEALGWTPVGDVAIKLSTGEGANSYNLDPALIGKLVKNVNGTIVECNTAYPGSRSSTEHHRQVAEERGYTAIADVDIMDAEGTMKLPVNGGKRLKTNMVGSHFADYGSFIVLSHFKGHTMGGYGGAIKNISIGIASSRGKCLIHTAGKSSLIMISPDQDAFLESMAEAGKSVSDSLGNGKNIVYINVMNNISVDCDCVANPSDPTMADVGILASTDPVAVDQACVDIVYEHRNSDGEDVIERIETRNGLHTLDHAEKIGLGSRSYELVNIDG